MSTCETAVGAKQGRAKGNKQKAEYLESDGKHGKPGWKEEEDGEGKAGTEKLKKPGCKAETVEKRKGNKQKLSSQKPKAEVDERKRKPWKNILSESER